MVNLAVVNFNLCEELELNVVVGLLGVAISGEGEAGGFEFGFQRGLVHVRHHDGEVDIVLFGVGRRGALRPGDCNRLDGLRFIISRKSRG